MYNTLCIVLIPTCRSCEVSQQTPGTAALYQSMNLPPKYHLLGGHNPRGVHMRMYALLPGVHNQTQLSYGPLEEETQGTTLFQFLLYY